MKKVTQETIDLIVGMFGSVPEAKVLDTTETMDPKATETLMRVIFAEAESETPDGRQRMEQLMGIVVDQWITNTIAKEYNEKLPEDEVVLYTGEARIANAPDMPVHFRLGGYIRRYHKHAMGYCWLALVSDETPEDMGFFIPVIVPMINDESDDFAAVKEKVDRYFMDRFAYASPENIRYAFLEAAPKFQTVLS